MAGPFLGWGDVNRWYNTAPGVTAPTALPTTAPDAAPGADPLGLRIGQYYTSAIANDPRMPAVQQNLASTIAPDVRRQIAQSAAERGISIGSYGGGNDETALLRALGLTSMDLRNKGVEQYGQIYGQVPQYSPATILGNQLSLAQVGQQGAAAGQQISAQNAARANAVLAANSAAWNQAKPTSPPMVGGFGGAGSSMRGPTPIDDTASTLDSILNRLSGRPSVPKSSGGLSGSTTAWGGFADQPPLTSGDAPQYSFDYNPWIDDYTDPYAGQVSNQLD